MRMVLKLSPTFLLFNWILELGYNWNWVWVWLAVDMSMLKGGQLASMRWFFVGMFFCLVGDVLLALPKDRFLAGLIAFLLGHLAYIAAFKIFPMRWEYWLPSGILAILVGMLWVRSYRRLAASLSARGQDAMKLPVGAYSLVLSVMVFADHASPS